MYSMKVSNTEYKTQDLLPGSALGLNVLDLLLSTAAGRIHPAMTEAQAQTVANETAFDTDEDEAGLVEALALEAEARDGYRFLCNFGPYDF